MAQIVDELLKKYSEFASAEDMGMLDESYKEDVDEISDDIKKSKNKISTYKK